MAFSDPWLVADEGEWSLCARLRRDSCVHVRDVKRVVVLTPSGGRWIHPECKALETESFRDIAHCMASKCQLTTWWWRRSHSQLGSAKVENISSCSISPRRKKKRHGAWGEEGGGRRQKKQVEQDQTRRWPFPYLARWGTHGVDPTNTSAQECYTKCPEIFH